MPSFGTQNIGSTAAPRFNLSNYPGLIVEDEQILLPMF